VILLDLAVRLRDAGLAWTPAAGDRFVVRDRDMDDDVFVLSDMTIEIHHLPDGPVIGFNGTTEWALDDLEQDEAIWLPREDQLRDQIGSCFHRLERTDDGYRVMATVDGAPRSFSGAHPEEAYGRALLHLLAARQGARLSQRDRNRWAKK
jgi:hypothetical protein